MKFNRSMIVRFVLLISLIASLTIVSSRMQADSGACGNGTTTIPFLDVADSFFFCQIAEAYFSGLTNGTSATTYSPGANVTREQMAAFITRTQNSASKRGNRRTAMGQFWLPQSNNIGLTSVGNDPVNVKSDGADLWVTNFIGNSVSRVRASDGKRLETWSGATQANGVLVAMGKVFVAGYGGGGTLYQIDPTQPAGAVTTIVSGTGDSPQEIAFDGTRIWIANNGITGSVSYITLNPVSVTTVTTGFSQLHGVIFDGTNIWITDSTLKRLDNSGNILQTVNVGSGPQHPAFDGTNIWVPNFSSQTVTVVRASTGEVLATLSGNGLDGPNAVAFDGERILVTNFGGGSVSLWKASDLTPLGAFSLGANSQPLGVCSDGINYWIALNGPNQLARF